VGTECLHRGVSCSSPRERGVGTECLHGDMGALAPAYCNRDIRQSIAPQVPSLSIPEYAHSRVASDDQTPLDLPKEILFP